MTTVNEASKARDPFLTNALFDDVIALLDLKNDAALSRAMGVAPPVISKARHGALPLGASYLIRLHELTGWAISDIKTRLGIEPYIPQNLRQQAA